MMTCDFAACVGIFFGRDSCPVGSFNYGVLIWWVGLRLTHAHVVDIASPIDPNTNS
jgi:hypothetical protein